MRELKFRVWGLYGDEYTYINEENQAEAESFWDKSCIAVLDEKHIVDCGTDEDGDGEGYEYCDVEEVETTEQYTGLKGKNGKEIYEGDIVRCSFGESGVVELRHGAYCVVGDDITDMSNWKESAFEVIGNIHENPELLEQEDGER